MLQVKVQADQHISSASISEEILLSNDYFEALIKDLQESKTSIDISTYIFSVDHLGSKFATVLSQAAQRGIEVRLLIDGIGARLSTAECINKMRDNGVKIGIYHPLPWVLWQWANAAHVPHNPWQRLIYSITRLNSRNHRKLCIIDDRIVYISSANIDARHLPKHLGGEGWRDSSVRIVGLDVTPLKQAFDLAWHPHGVRRLIRKYVTRRANNSAFHLNYSRAQRRRVLKNLVARLNNAKQRIWITNAYFVPDHFILRALIAAAKRNIDVRIILPRESDVAITTLVATTFYSTLIKNGVLIFHYVPAILHAKTMIIDDWYSLGSSNLNTRSFKHDLEVDVTLSTQAAKNKLEEQFSCDLMLSTQIQLEDLRKQSLFKTWLANLLLFIRYFI